MQRKILLFGLTLLTVVLLTACGGQAAPATTEAAPIQAAVQPTEVVSTEPASTVAPTDAAVTEQPAAPASVSFANDIKPILENRCIQCHGGNQTQKGLDMKTYESLMAGSENGTVVTAGDAGKSSLVDQLLKGKMPKRGPKLTPDQVQLISDWINAGAQNN
jgi:mono/diheme cytochrome c family protein